MSGGLTASSGDSPAKTSATPESAPESTGSEAACGPNTPGSFAWYDRDSQLWRTWQHSLLGGLIEFSETWPRAGMTRNGTAFRLWPLVPRTSGIESFLWPTPNVPNGGRSVPEDADWTTPRCAYRKNGKKIQVGLESAVRRWPTPRAADAARGPDYGGTVNHEGGGNLLGAVRRRRCRPPAASDWKGIFNPATVARRASESTRGVRLPEQVSREEGNSGALNPPWVEWLMGFPLGWTDLEDSETPSSRKSRSGSGDR
jgi:hypothetical protein